MFFRDTVTTLVNPCVAQAAFYSFLLVSYSSATFPTMTTQMSARAQLCVDEVTRLANSRFSSTFSSVLLPVWVLSSLLFCSPKHTKLLTIKLDQCHNITNNFFSLQSKLLVPYLSHYSQDTYQILIVNRIPTCQLLSV